MTAHCRPCFNFFLARDCWRPIEVTTQRPRTRHRDWSGMVGGLGTVPLPAQIGQSWNSL